MSVSATANGDCLSSTTVTNSTQGYPITVLRPAAPDVSGITTVCSGGSTTLTASGGTAGNYRWYDASYNLLPNTSTQFNTGALTSSKIYYVSYVVYGDVAECESPKRKVTVEVIDAAEPPILLTGNKRCGTGEMFMEVSGDYSLYEWIVDGNIDNENNTNAYTVNLPDLNTPIEVKVKGIISAGVCESDYLTFQVEAVENCENYIHETTVISEGITTEEELKLATVEDKTDSWTYFDGLGRVKQNLIQQGSPNLHKDLVQPIEYDNLGKQSRNYLQYVSDSQDGFYKTNAATEVVDYYNPSNTSNLAKNVTKDLIPYSETIYEPSPLNVPKEVIPQGSNWRDVNGTARDASIKPDYRTNRENEVRFWQMVFDSKIDGLYDKVVSSAYYLENQLWVNVFEDENEKGAKVYEYVDKEGRVILKKSIVEYGVSEYSNVWAETYYVYDLLGNLRYVIPPKAVEDMKTSGWEQSYNKNFIENWFFYYEYDDQGRLTHKKIPGAEMVYFVYDERDRLVLTQDGNQRNSTYTSGREWSFIKYDDFNRPIMTGLYEHSSVANQRHMQDHVNDLSYQLNESFDGTGDHGYSNSSFPREEDVEILTVTYYDGYDFLNKSYFETGTRFNYVKEGCSAIAYSTAVKGLVTASKVKLMDPAVPDKFLKTVAYYDDRYRLIQSLSENHKGGVERFTSCYDDLTSNVKQSLLRTNLPEEMVVIRSYDYDHMGRLKKIGHQINDNDPIVLAEFVHNELGQVIEKKLHSIDGGVTFWQNIDYQYNIRGWLTHINNATLDDGEGDLFGMEFYYETGFDEVYYNGNISGIKWMSGLDKERLNYGYIYDAQNRIKNAHFIEGADSEWDREGHFNLEIKGYDYNGNITGLKRYGEVEGRHVAVDDLDYNYAGGGNQLQLVTDNGTNESFKDGNKTGIDYIYDDNGNLIVDKNKNITKITYNRLNLPKTIEIGDDKMIEYVYDAVGIKLSKRIYEDKTAAPTKVMDYLGEMIFENEELKAISHEEGRVIPAFARGAATWTPEYQYHLRDHLGNVRVTFGEKEYSEYLATMEDDPPFQRIYEVEELGFENITETEYNEIAALDHTHKILNPETGDPFFPNANVVAYLDGHENIFGPAKSVKVMPGDEVEIKVFAKYEEIDLSNTNAVTVTSGAILGAFLGAFHTAGSEFLINQGIVNSEILIFGNLDPRGLPADYDPNGEAVPNAYLNYILFDKNFNIVNQDKLEIDETGVVNPDVPGLGQHQELGTILNIQQDGYLYVYVSNETQFSKVYFDDLGIYHSKSRIIQKNDYYPFGSDMVALSSSREGAYPNNYLYQSKETHDEFNIYYYDFPLRMYDPVIGRWNSADPYDQFTSPYLGMGNNPTNVIDPDGGWGWSWVGFGVGAVVGGVSGYIASDGDWRYTLGGAAVGGVAGGFLGDMAHSTTNPSYGAQNANLWDRFTSVFGEGHVDNGIYFPNRKLIKKPIKNVGPTKKMIKPIKISLLKAPYQASKLGTSNFKELPGIRDIPLPRTQGVTLVDGDVNSLTPAAPQVQTGWNILQNIAFYLSRVEGSSVDIAFINTRFPLGVRQITQTLRGNTITSSSSSTTFQMQPQMVRRLNFVQNSLIRLGAPLGSVNINRTQFNYYQNNSSVGFRFR